MNIRILCLALLLASPATCLAQAGGNADGSTATHGADDRRVREELDDLRAQMRELSRRMATLSDELGESGPRVYAMRYLGEPGRAFAGIVLAAGQDGVHVGAVTPNSPAARAGLRVGDIVTAVRGEPIRAGTPAAQLAQARERLADLADGDEVEIGYRRGTQAGVVTFEAERREAWSWPSMIAADVVRSMPSKEELEHIREQARAAADRALRENDQRDAESARAIARANADAARTTAHAMVRAKLAMPWWGLNLAPLNAELGRYFGTDSGALLLSADDGALPGLRGGDVITHVAGKPIERPEDVMRALRDEPPGGDVAVDVLRERAPLALSIKTPGFKSIFSFAPPAPPEPPAPPPPEPPAPPQPPAPPRH